MAHEAFTLTGGFDDLQRLEMKREADESEQELSIIDALEAGVEVTTKDGRHFKFAGINYDADKDEVIAGWVGTSLLGFTISGCFSLHGNSRLDLIIKGK